jgi:hypothetical protein
MVSKPPSVQTRTAFSCGSAKTLSCDRDCNLSDRSREHFGDELGSLILDRRVRPDLFPAARRCVPISDQPALIARAAPSLKCVMRT